MRSQRIALLSLGLLNVQSSEIREKIQSGLQSEINDMETTHENLLSGNLKGSTDATKSDEINKIFFSELGIDHQVKNFISVARNISNANTDTINLKNSNFFAVTEQSSQLLNKFEELIMQYKEEGRVGIDELHHVAQRTLVIMVLTSLAIGAFIFLPTIRRLKGEFFNRGQTQKTLLDQNGELEQFASFIAHDLKAPLSNIGGFGQFLKSKLKDKEDKEALELLEYIEQGVKRMSQMINELLEYSRLGNNQRKKEKINLNETLDKVLKDFELKISETQAQINISKLPVVYGDPIQIEHLFQNLLSNALKFKHESRKTKVSIFPKLHSHNGHNVSTIVIEDNGQGFPHGATEKMFQPFRRLHTEESTEGSGFGLALCKKIMKKHFGFIQAEQVATGGARFILYFGHK